MDPRAEASEHEIRTRLRWHCAACGATAPERARHCMRCGQPLWQPERSCSRCGQVLRDRHDRHCMHCGAAARLRSGSPLGSSAWRRLGGAFLVAVALATVVKLNQAPSPPSLGDLKVGDPVARVSHRLGRPARPPREVLWNGRDGAPHRACTWEYALLPDGHDVVPRISVTFLDDRVFQIGVLDGRFTTDQGLKVGDRLDKARRLYGTAIEETPVAGLIPLKFLRGGVVIKVVIQPGGNRVLALGLESPESLPVPEDRMPASSYEDVPQAPI